MAPIHAEHRTAFAWCRRALGEPIVAVDPLSGGLTSSMFAVTDAAGRDAVLRLMTVEPWRTHGADLTTRERNALLELEDSGIPAPRSIALDAAGEYAGAPAHLMTRLAGRPTDRMDARRIGAMASTLLSIHAIHPREPFREFQSWAWEDKWVVPAWTSRPDHWSRAFDILRSPAPDFEPRMLHRDFSHRNLLWTGDRITGVVDWVETSTGPAWLDAAHAATNLALGFGVAQAQAFITEFARAAGSPPETYWLIMDAVGFLPAPGRRPLFGTPQELARLDDWLDAILAGQVLGAT